MKKVESRILVVEDDLNLGFLLMELLEGEKYHVKLCRDGLSALDVLKKEAFSICILDIMLPNMDGFELARKIKKINDTIPFLFLTARTMKEDLLRGFAIGAEDFITKPFDEQELLCRLRVILRREELVEKEHEEPILQFEIGDYSFDYSKRELCYNGKAMRITEKENEVLRLLCLHKNQVLKRDEAVEQIYGKQDYFLGRSFDVFISRLRKLLKDDPRLSIENVYRVGFILNERLG